ncbi:MAG: hypothetical protein KGI27_12680 [Thaumarchaeota archaeon]|nr:hypothetical protein [Nitrososphaerota archaeon]
MEKISTLIILRNDWDLGLDLIRDIYDITDQIVIMDCSDFKLFKKFNKKIKKFNLDKVKVFRAPALGYADPLRSYGLSKCKYNWVLYLDTDERLSKELKKNIKIIINKTKCNAFAIRRYEYIKNRVSQGIFSWQVRLYKKDSVEFNGVIHELPIVKGSIQALDKKNYFMKHIQNQTNTKEKLEVYYTLEAFEHRISYKSLLKFCHDRNLPKLPLKLYFKIKNIDLKKELSKSEYKTFLSIYKLYIKMLNIFPFLSSEKYLGWVGKVVYKDKKNNSHNYYNEMIQFFFTFPEKERELQLSIANNINNKGVINYLGLYNENVIKRIGSKSEKSGLKGVDLFVYILKSRYTKGRNYYKKL